MRPSLVLLGMCVVILDEEKRPRGLYTREEVQGLLRISRTNLYELTKQGAISAVKIGRSVRYRVSDVEAYIAALPSLRALREREFRAKNDAARGRSNAAQ
jgi:excisionase family DNA binding protein